MMDDMIMVVISVNMILHMSVIYIFIVLRKVSKIEKNKLSALNHYHVLKKMSLKMCLFLLTV